MYLLLGFVDVFLWLIQQPCNMGISSIWCLSYFHTSLRYCLSMSSNALSTLRGESGTESLGSFHRLEDCLILPW